MSDLSKLFSVFSLPGKINTLITTVEGLLNNGPMQAIADADVTFKTFLTDVTADAAELKTDASKFTWHNIGEWLSDFEKLCTDATTIGLQVVSLYEGLTVDPAVAGSLGVVLTIIKDIAALLGTIGIKIPTPALSPAATKAVTTPIEPVTAAPVTAPVVDTVNGDTMDTPDDPTSYGGSGGPLI